MDVTREREKRARALAQDAGHNIDQPNFESAVRLVSIKTEYLALSGKQFT